MYYCSATVNDPTSVCINLPKCTSHTPRSLTHTNCHRNMVKTSVSSVPRFYPLKFFFFYTAQEIYLSIWGGCAFRHRPIWFYYRITISITISLPFCASRCAHMDFSAEHSWQSMRQCARCRASTLLFILTLAQTHARTHTQARLCITTRANTQAPRVHEQVFKFCFLQIILMQGNQVRQAKIKLR